MCLVWACARCDLDDLKALLPHLADVLIATEIEHGGAGGLVRRGAHYPAGSRRRGAHGSPWDRAWRLAEKGPGPSGQPPWRPGRHLSLSRPSHRRDRRLSSSASSSARPDIAATCCELPPRLRGCLEAVGEGGVAAAGAGGADGGGLLDAIHGEHRRAGCVIDGEHGVFAGFGLRVAGVRRHLEHVGYGSALPVIFWRSSGRAVRVRGGTSAHGRQQRGRRRGACSVTACFRVRAAGPAGRVGSRGPAAGVHGGAGPGGGAAAAGAVRVVRGHARAASGVAAGAAV